jgi:hypothetical protein
MRASHKCETREEITMWMQLLAILGAGALIWWLWHYIRRNPGAFSAENLNKSFFSMGILAVILIAVVAVLVWIVRST